MAQCCTRIRKLNVRDTRQVSDGGLVEVAKNCPSLEWLNTSRSEMPFKITDVGLLSIAENCPLLRHLEVRAPYSNAATRFTRTIIRHDCGLLLLQVQGCDCVTDVGLTWLGRGCRCLVHLDIKNCSKVTNAGVRSISEGCHLLEFLDLTNIKRVTDVGVRHIAHHCTKIKRLNLSGLYLLTDGMKRDFGLEGLQALSVAAPDLTYSALTQIACCCRPHIRRLCRFSKPCTLSSPPLHLPQIPPTRTLRPSAATSTWLAAFKCRRWQSRPWLQVVLFAGLKI
mmetsp:Transcript_47599/g.131928  ORF Transcript_47599/g.131928 Transcript_47599/m.131928 type:complete len:281 (-) Transcript_47599:3357-4199(-)